jgi:hypothetical protein
MAVSASTVRFVSQCLFLVCRFNSVLEKGYVCVVDYSGEERVGFFGCWCLLLGESG